ncbi:cyclin-D4-1-like [Mangifera indica]|uniref:cyclin-D4-1-like n=1 Tax=Mangifera indica TaxID=29780 RepID=UPI001CF98DEC|nr:cyclin-D4-1-like [Mangifera indica]
MATSFDSAVSSLLCTEDNNCIFDDINTDYNGVVVEEFEASLYNADHQTRSQNKRFDDWGDIFPLQSDECLVLMLEKECQHLPNGDYLKRLQIGDLDLVARKEAVNWIVKVNAHFGFGPLCAYLSINYLDRFLSAYELPKGKAWMMQLLSVACLSLAAKMEETQVPSCLDLQVGESKFLFEARTIKRMELLVLSTLRWRMQAITPFSYIDYFIRKISDGDQIQLRTLCLSSIQLIISTIKGIELLEFKPSEVAAAVAIYVTGETKTVDTKKAISLLTQYVNKERIVECVKIVQDLSLISADACVPQSPIGVLDAACLSYKSDDTTVGSCPSSSNNTPDPKRRKPNRPCEVEL